MLKRQCLNRDISLATRRAIFELSVQGLLVFGLTRCSISFDTLTEENCWPTSGMLCPNVQTHNGYNIRLVVQNDPSERGLLHCFPPTQMVLIPLVMNEGRSGKNKLFIRARSWSFSELTSPAKDSSRLYAMTFQQRFVLCFCALTLWTFVFLQWPCVVVKYYKRIFHNSPVLHHLLFIAHVYYLVCICLFRQHWSLSYKQKFWRSPSKRDVAAGGYKWIIVLVDELHQVFCKKECNYTKSEESQYNS